jgi:peptidoglycan/xylan/chitin deacetylase (PgdA/CDA1 family)
VIACKRLIKSGLVGSRLLNLAQRFRGPRTVILRYHSVRDEPNEYATSVGKGIVHATSAFRQQMEWLARHYEPITLDDVAAALRGDRPMPRRGVAVTFDDGYSDNVEIAMPILNRLGMPGAFYITTGCIEPHKMPWFCRLRHAFANSAREEWSGPAGDASYRLTDRGEQRQAFLAASRSCARHAGASQEELIGRIECELGVAPLAPPPRLMMTWEQVRELRRQGHVVGSHTVTHPNLAQVTPDEVATEMREARIRLEEQLGEPVVHFSYPSPILQPHWSPQTIDTCREVGYQTAVTCTAGAVLAGDAPLCLKRMSAPEDLADFKWAVQCAFLGRYV